MSLRCNCGFPDLIRSCSSSRLDHAGPGRFRTRSGASCGRWMPPWTSPQPPANLATSRTPALSSCRGLPARTLHPRPPSASLSQRPPPRTLPLCAALRHWHPPAASFPGGTRTDAPPTPAWTALRTGQTPALRLYRARPQPVREPGTGMRATARPTAGEPGQRQPQRAPGGKRLMMVGRRLGPAVLPPAAAPRLRKSPSMGT